MKIDYAIEHQAPPGEELFPQRAVFGAHVLPRVGENVEVDGFCTTVIAVLHTADTHQRFQPPPIVRVK